MQPRHGVRCPKDMHWLEKGEAVSWLLSENCKSKDAYLNAGGRVGTGSAPWMMR